MSIKIKINKNISEEKDVLDENILQFATSIYNVFKAIPGLAVDKIKKLVDSIKQKIPNFNFNFIIQNAPQIFEVINQLKKVQSQPLPTSPMEEGLSQLGSQISSKTTAAYNFLTKYNAAVAGIAILMYKVSSFMEGPASVGDDAELALAIELIKKGISGQAITTTDLPNIVNIMAGAAMQKIGENKAEAQIKTIVKETIAEVLLFESELGYDTAELEDGTPVCEACLYESMTCGCPDVLEEAKYQGRSVPLGKPMRGDVKKFKVFVRDPSTGNIKKVNFGDPNMRIKKSNPKRRKSFRARHNCDNPGPRTKARYWSCRKW